MTSANGGPAFPVPGLQHDEDFNGMSLRDYFAARALPAVIAAAFIDGVASRSNGGDVTESIIAQQSYHFADAMLAARGAA